MVSGLTAMQVVGGNLGIEYPPVSNPTTKGTTGSTNDSNTRLRYKYFAYPFFLNRLELNGNFIPQNMTTTWKNHIKTCCKMQ